MLDSGDWLVDEFNAEIDKVYRDFEGEVGTELNILKFKDRIMKLSKLYEAKGLDKNYISNKIKGVIEC